MMVCIIHMMESSIIEVTGCESFNYNNPVYADQMTWWVYNDNGNLHTQTNGLAMKWNPSNGF